ncbi:MAG: hypothetical protein GTO03_07090 [Planctomycetales bacterium]|nr:hypothetical protein [Planctomycetales bacterium]
MARHAAQLGAEQVDRRRWRPWRPLVSLLLLVHLAVVIATPLAMVTPQSRLAVWVTQWSAPYLQAGNISHGYAFFAPDPGPGHLLRYEIEYEDGSRAGGQLPDGNRHWPRLLYHRHFMLSEQLAALAVPATGPPRPAATDDERVVAEWKADFAAWRTARQRFLQRARSYARHLLTAHAAQEVRLYLTRHEIPTAADVRRGAKLTDKKWYIEYSRQPVVTVRAEEES